MSEVFGTLYLKKEVQQVSEKFSKLEFVVFIAENPSYPEKVLFVLTNGNTSKLDGIENGDEIVVKYNLKGREWTNPEGKVMFFNTLEAWFVAKKEKYAQDYEKSESASNKSDGILDNFKEQMIQGMVDELEDDDLPF